MDMEAGLFEQSEFSKSIKFAVNVRLNLSDMLLTTNLIDLLKFQKFMGED